MRNSEPESERTVSDDFEFGRFMDSWRKAIASDDPRDEIDVVRALDACFLYSHPEIQSFIVSCIDHHAATVRNSAVSALANLIIDYEDSDQIAIIIRVLENDPSPAVRAAAAASLGRVSRKFAVPDFLHTLISMLKDPEFDNFERLHAYKGLIYAMDMQGHPDFHPFRLDPHKPVEEQVNWSWVESLEASLGEGE